MGFNGTVLHIYPMGDIWEHLAWHLPFSFITPITSNTFEKNIRHAVFTDSSLVGIFHALFPADEIR